MSLNYKHNPEKWSLVAFPQYVHHRLIWQKQYNLEKAEASLQRSRGGGAIDDKFISECDRPCMKMQIIIHILKSGCDKTIEDDGYLGQDSHDSISLPHNGNKSHCGRHKGRLNSHNARFLVLFCVPSPYAHLDRACYPMRSRNVHI